MEASSLDVALTEDQQLIADTVADLARSSIAPRHELLDQAGTHPQELWDELAGLGLFGSFLPEDLGGAGMGFVAHVLAVEGLARAAGLAGVLPVAQGLVLDALVGCADPDIQGAHLEGLATGEVLGAPALLEEDSGHLATRAAGGGADLRVTGAKALVPHPERAGLYVVRARGEEGPVLVLVEASAPGLTHAAQEGGLGLRGFETGALILEDCAARRLGGADLLGRVLDGARLAVGALLAGVARGALEHAVRYAGERVQFGGPLLALGAIQERLARCDARAAALRALVHGGAALRDAGREHHVAALRARSLADAFAPEIAHEALQVFGGYGYSREYPAERYYRDARFPGFGEHHAGEGAAHVTEALSGG